MSISEYRRAANSVVLPVTSGEDLKRVRKLLNPNRLAMLALIHEKRSLTVAELIAALSLSQKPTETGLEALEGLGFIQVSKEKNPGHGLRRVIISLLPQECDFVDIRLALGETQEP